MKRITNMPQRRLSFAVDGDHVIIQEQELFTPGTFSKRAKWTDDRVSVTVAELRRILVEAERPKPMDESDPCANCGIDFFEHNNGQCPDGCKTHFRSLKRKVS